MCADDRRNGRNRRSHLLAAGLAAAKGRLAAANPSRAALVISPDTTSILTLFSGTSTAQQSIIQYLPATPVSILRVEDLGDFVTGELWTSGSGALNTTIITEIIDSEPLP